MKSSELSNGGNHIALRQLLQNRKWRHLWRHNLGSRWKLQKIARDNFIIGAFYNITKNQDNPIKTVGRDSFWAPKPLKYKFLGVTQPPGTNTWPWTNKAIVDDTSPAPRTPVTPFPPTGDAAYRQHAGGATEPRTYATYIKKLIKIALAIPEISCRTNRQTDTQTHRQTDRQTDALITYFEPLPQAK